MYFCYVDESGHCGTKYDSNQPVEVLVGVVSDASKIHKTNREHSNFLGNLLIKYGIEVSELKSAQIIRGRKEWSSIDAKEAALRAMKVSILGGVAKTNSAVKIQESSGVSHIKHSNYGGK